MYLSVKELSEMDRLDFVFDHGQRVSHDTGRLGLGDDISHLLASL